MRSFEFSLPTEIFFGPGCWSRLPGLLKHQGVRKVLLHYGSDRLLKNGFLKKIELALFEAGISAVRFGGVVPNPVVETVREGIELAVEEGVDFIVAIGGGSVIDSAKAIAIGLSNTEVDVWEVFQQLQPPHPPVGLAAILTLPAAGSETSTGYVLSNHEVNEKRGFDSPLNRPQYAFLDPKLCIGLSKPQIACGIVDIMMHTMERYFCRYQSENETSDALAEAVLRTVIRIGQKLYENPRDEHAMSELMWCGSLSHNDLTGLGGEGDWATHQLSHILSMEYDKPHAAALSAIWGSWAQYSAVVDNHRLANYARKVWGVKDDDNREAAHMAILLTEAFWRSMGMPTTLVDLCDKQTPLRLARFADIATKNDTEVVGSFPPLHRKAVLTIFKLANKDQEGKSELAALHRHLN